MDVTTTPYSLLPAISYWHSGVAETRAQPDNTYCTPKRTIAPGPTVSPRPEAALLSILADVFVTPDIR